MNPSPAFQLYPQDFLVGTADMDLTQVGAYIRLLCYQWAKGGLPNDPQKLASMVGCGGNAMALPLDKFRICEDGMLRNDKLERVRLEQDEYRKKQAENARKRWVGSATALPTDMPNACSSPSPSPSPSSVSSKFREPTPQEVEEYARSIQFNLDGEYFLDYQRTRGWKLKSGVAVKDWRACVRTWKTLESKRNGSQPKEIRPSYDEYQAAKGDK